MRPVQVLVRLRYTGPPSEADAIYFQLNLASLLMLSYYLLMLYRTPYFDIWILGALCYLVFRTLSAVRQLSRPEPPPTVQAVLRSAFSALSGTIEYKIHSGQDFRAVEAFGRKICLVPAHLLDDLGSADENANPFRGAIAHEAGHLMSQDTRRYQRAAGLLRLTILSALLFLVAVVPGFPQLGMTIAWAPMQVASSLTLLGYYFFAALRVRELHADAAAAALVGSKALEQILAPLERRARFLRLPMWYRLTHPAPAERLKGLMDFSRGFAYTAGRCTALGILTGLTSVGFQLAGYLFSRGRSEKWIEVSLWLVSLCPHYPVVLTIAGASMLRLLSPVRCIGRAVQFISVETAAAFLFGYLATGASPAKTIRSWGQGGDNSLIHRVVAYAGPAERLVAPLLATVVGHLLVWAGCRKLHPGSVDRRWKTWFWPAAALVTSFASFNCADVLWCLMARVRPVNVDEVRSAFTWTAIWAVLVLVARWRGRSAADAGAGTYGWATEHIEQKQLFLGGRDTT